jgi:hypothetical protein
MVCFRIFERHYIAAFGEEGNVYFADKKDGWIRVNYCFDPAEKTIADFCDFPLFDDEGEFVANGTKVNFFDGTYVICCNSFQWFIDNVLPVYSKQFEKPENNDVENQ